MAARELDVLILPLLKVKSSVVEILQNNNPSGVVGGVTSINPLILKSKTENTRVA